MISWNALLLAGLVFSPVFQDGPDGEPEPTPAPPRLVVLVHVNAFRADYLERFGPLLEDDGLRRIASDGAVYEQAEVTHATATLAPGAVALATGCLPGRAGIPADRWFDRRTRKHAGATLDRKAVARGSDEGIATGPASARNLERPTLGDLMQEHFGEESVVLSLSWMDTTALLLGGNRSDGSYWIDPHTGTWVSSSRLLPKLPEWMAAENERGAIHKYVGEVWERSFTDEVGNQYASPDDDPDEPPFGGMPWFPYEIPEYALTPTVVRKAVDATPFADMTVMDAVRTALDAEQLGQDDVPDLLCVSFSALGIGGRDYGPDSQEVMDLVLRLDRRVAELLRLLDEVVGEDRWTLALTSTQGLARLPSKTGALSMRSTDVLVPVELGLRMKYTHAPVEDLDSWTVGTAGPWIFLSHSMAEKAEVDPADVATVAADLAEQLPGVAEAVTQEQLRESTDPTWRRWARELHPTRSGDVLMLLERDTVLNAGVGTHYGTHHDYDRRVPFMLVGAGVAADRHVAAADPVDVVPTLAEILGLPVPEDLDGRVLSEALSGAP